MRSFFDRPEIMQIYQFMQHPKSSYLDLQFPLAHSTFEARDIQKNSYFYKKYQ